MPIIVIEHPVADFQGWKKAFDSDPLGRARNGVTQHVVFRSAEDPNQVVVSLRFASLEAAQKFLPPLRQMWQRVGDRIGFAADQVKVRLLEEVERVDY